MRVCNIDVETYSESGYILCPTTKKIKSPPGMKNNRGLAGVGAAVYAEHESTRVIVAYYKFSDSEELFGWYPERDPQIPQNLRRHIESGGIMSAFNMSFEWFNWHMCLSRQVPNLPPIPIENCRCSMAQAATYAIPHSLKAAAEYLGASQKLESGKSLISALCVPRNWTKARQYWRETCLLQTKLLAKYCRGDVVAEVTASARMPQLTEQHQRLWEVDQRINVRGVQVDTDMLAAALPMIEQTQDHYNAELAQLTNGAVTKGSQIKQLTQFIASHGVHTDDLGKDTVEELLQLQTLPPVVRRALELRQIISSTSTSKYLAYYNRMNSDGRLRGQYAFNSARTGRWNGSGAQLMNQASGGPASKTCDDCGLIVGKVCRDCPQCDGGSFTDNPEWTVEGAKAVKAIVKQGDFNQLVNVWGRPDVALKGALRSTLIAKPGYKLICYDFTAIEAVVSAMISGCQWRIDAIRNGTSLYLMSASAITGVSVEAMLEYAKREGRHHPDRSKGKVAELALGFQGSFGAMLAMGASDYMTEDEIKAAVKAWRKASPEIVEMWGGQFKGVEYVRGYYGPKTKHKPHLYGLEGAFICAVQNPNTVYNVRSIAYCYDNQRDVMQCRLPSGRIMYYHKPRLASVEKWGRKQLEIRFMGNNKDPNKGKVGWTCLTTYGGKLYENVVQAIAFDLQANALIGCEYAGLNPVMHTHDEIVCEVPEQSSDYDFKRMGRVMTDLPPWAAGWPVKADGWIDDCYQKD